VPFSQRVVWMRTDEQPSPQVSGEDEQPPATGPGQTEAEVTPTGEAEKGSS
jgi:hypothetical protein